MGQRLTRAHRATGAFLFRQRRKEKAVKVTSDLLTEKEKLIKNNDFRCNKTNGIILLYTKVKMYIEQERRGADV